MIEIKSGRDGLRRAISSTMKHEETNTGLQIKSTTRVPLKRDLGNHEFCYSLKQLQAKQCFHLTKMRRTTFGLARR